ncbi:rhamnulokinase family protein [Haloferula sp. BvORR071]|uniref:rhamnulokinase n=1 Tax=Haloferula sp. BvORR071 TaxID=1396141 RepID=UPI00054D73F0|nr:rhamnulokinase family protein [Haloferula sp. BvORR071]
MPVFLAIDLGAGSGRVIAGIADDAKLELQEIHRFDNPGTDLPGGSYWNIIGLFRDIVEGLRRGVEKYGKEIVAMGIDTWGCDFGLLDGHGRLLGNPHQYRDARHEGMPAVMHARLSEAEIYAQTGITTNFYNSSLHLMAEEQACSPALASANQLLFIPDLLAYWLSGKKVVERTIASTSQLLDASTGDWAWGVIETLGLPSRIFGKIVPPGTVLGPILPEVARLIGMEGIPVVASASHDTASAVAGIPMEGEDALWLSSGTWSIMGLETREPIRTPAAFAARCCNELGVEGTVRFLKNIAGLWLIQECKRQWALDGEALSYGEMAKLAADAPAFSAFIDPDDAIFAAPGEMPNKIRAWCERTGQAVPQDKGTILRIASESLALKYRVVFENFCALSGKRFERLYAGGGGIQNAFLAQATSNALGIEVVAGPIEATSCGNIVVQMIATGALPDLAAGRALIRRSFDFQTYQPQQQDDWQAAYQRFKSVIAS